MKSKINYISVLALLLLFAINLNAQEQSNRPNVIFILADNVGYGDIGAFQGGEIRGMPTPRIDKLANEGLTLTQFITEPGCTPISCGINDWTLCTPQWPWFDYRCWNSKYFGSK